MFVLALFGLGLTYVWIYAVATHGPRLFGVRVEWFEGVTRWGVKVRAAVLSTVITLVACLSVGLVLSLGIPKESTSTRVTVVPGSPAERGGIQTNDVITAIGPTRIESFEQIQDAVRQSHGPLDVEVRRGGERLRFTVQPLDQRVGVQGVTKSERRTLAEATLLLSEVFLRTASNAFRPSLSASQLVGPAAVLREVSGSGKKGRFSMLYCSHKLPCGSSCLAFTFLTSGHSRSAEAGASNRLRGVTLSISLLWGQLSSFFSCSRSFTNGSRAALRGVHCLTHLPKCSGSASASRASRRSGDIFPFVVRQLCRSLARSWGRSSGLER